MDQGRNGLLSTSSSCGASLALLFFSKYKWGTFSVSAKETWPHLLPIFCNLKNNITATATSGNSTATTSSTSSFSCGGEVLENKEIKEICKKWLWKGQFSINYFVSCNSDSQSNPWPSSSSCSWLWCLHSSLAQEY